MATLVVCDRCNTREGVRSTCCGGTRAVDLCHECAMYVVDELVVAGSPASGPILDRILGNKVGINLGPPRSAAAPPPTELPPGPLPSATVAKQRRTALSFQHQADVFYLRLAPEQVPASLPARIQVGDEWAEVLEAAPENPIGNYFAKAVKG